MGEKALELEAHNRATADRPINVAFLSGSQRFRVVGILREKGSFLGDSQDNIVLIPYTMAIKMYPTTRRKLAMSAQATSEEEVPEAKAQIVNLLRRRHGLTAYQPNDFQIRTQDEILQTFNNMSLVATTVLTGIVGISLLVGGIGIMNVMLVSVTERTREIGVRVSVGATEESIQLQFLGESVALSLVGGAAGVLLGIVGSYLVGQTLKWPIELSVEAVLIAALFSIAVGVFFGYYPARKASLLDPIEALRYE